MRTVLKGKLEVTGYRRRMKMRGVSRGHTAKFNSMTEQYHMKLLRMHSLRKLIKTFILFFLHGISFYFKQQLN